MSAVKSATLPVAGATAQSKCREALKHSQSYRRCLHRHPLAVAGASPSPSPLHTHATCTRSGSSLGMWVSLMDAVACFPTPCWKSMWLLKNSASFTPHEFRITAVNRFDCSLEALNLVCYILLWGGGELGKRYRNEKLNELHRLIWEIISLVPLLVISFPSVCRLYIKAVQRRD